MKNTESAPLRSFIGKTPVCLTFSNGVSATFTSIERKAGSRTLLTCEYEGTTGTFNGAELVTVKAPAVPAMAAFYTGKANAATSPEEKAFYLASATEANVLKMDVPPVYAVEFTAIELHAIYGALERVSVKVRAGAGQSAFDKVSAQLDAIQTHKATKYTGRDVRGVDAREYHHNPAGWDVVDV